MDVLKSKSTNVVAKGAVKPSIIPKSNPAMKLQKTESKEDQVKRLWNKAVAYQVDDDPQKALDTLLQAQEIDPDNSKIEVKITKLVKKIKSLQKLQDLKNGWYRHEDSVYLTPNARKPFKTKAAFYDQLLPHQKQGIRWLWGLYRQETGGVLGDDMGLGKTVQISAFLYGLFVNNHIERALLIMPKSVMLNWENELKKWCPRVRVALFHGTADKRQRVLDDILETGGIVLTTYGTAQNAVAQLTKNPNAEPGHDSIFWDVIVLDEGHKIKDPSKKTSKAIQAIDGRSKFVLSGTPIMNNLKELWALFDYACDGQLLGDLKTFKEQFEARILAGSLRNAKEEDRQRGFAVAEALRRLIEPHFLRREKAEVFGTDSKKPETIPSVPTNVSSPSSQNMMSPTTPKSAAAARLPPTGDLPASPSLKKLTITAQKNDFICWVYLSQKQIQLYQTFLTKEDALIRSVIAKTKSALPVISLLRKICDHPRLLSSEQQNVGNLGLDNSPQSPASLIEQSGKLKFLMDLLANLKQENHRVLIFSGSTKMLDIIQTLLVDSEYRFSRIDGTISKLKDRQSRIDEFNEDKGIFCFLLTTGVGGVGLNLTSADRVVIFDPAWNSLDDQATDRAYRMGQTKNVVIYRLITCGTIEEKMYRKQVFKGGLSRQMTGKTQQQFSFFTKGELSELFSFEDPMVSETQQLLAKLMLDKTPDRRQSIDTHKGFLGKMETLYGLSRHDQVYKITEGATEEIEGIEDIVSQSAKKLQKTIVSRDVVDFEREQARDEYLEKQKEKRLPGAKVLVLVDDDDDLVGPMSNLNLGGSQRSSKSPAAESNKIVSIDLTEEDIPASPTKFASPKKLDESIDGSDAAGSALDHDDVEGSVQEEELQKQDSAITEQETTFVDDDEIVIEEDIIIEEDEEPLEETVDTTLSDDRKSIGNRRKSMAFLDDEAEEVSLTDEIQELPDDEEELEAEEEGEDITNETSFEARQAEDEELAKLSMGDFYDNDEAELVESDASFHTAAADSDVEEINDDAVDEKQLLIEQLANLTLSDSGSRPKSTTEVAPAQREVEVEVEIQLKTTPKKPLKRLRRKMIIEEDEDDEIDASPVPARKPFSKASPDFKTHDENDDPVDILDFSPGFSKSSTKSPKKISSRLSDVSLPPLRIADDGEEDVDEYDFDDDFLVPDDSDEEGDGGYSHSESEADDQSSESSEDEVQIVSSKTPKKIPSTPARSSNSVTDMQIRDERTFVRERVSLAQRLFTELNDIVFGGRLPKDMTLSWRKTKAVVGLFVMKRQGGVESFYITLSKNYITSFQQLMDTLSHEMCHAAARLIDKDTDRSHHGPVWWKWARTVMALYKGKITITVKCADPH